MAIEHCFADDALGSLDAVGVAGAIRGGERSREEVLQSAIARVARVQPQLRGMVLECFDRARAQPAMPGPFAGVPSFVKDNVDVRGLPTCHGSLALRPRPAKSDAPPARQFLAQGFVMLGKSALPELSLTASAEYVDRAPARNPWGTDRSVGGSSGGAAALVASGAVPIAHGNDGGGSIRIPAAVSGLVGLKATRCRMLDAKGTRQLPVNVVAEGVLTRTVRDSAHYLAAAEAYHPNRALPSIGLVEGPAERRLRIGVVDRDVFDREAHPEMRATLSSVAATLAANGHELVPTRLRIDPVFIEDFKLYWSLLAVLMCASMAGRLRPRELDPFTRGLLRMARCNPARHLAAVRRLRQGPRIYDEHFDDIDVLLSPVIAHPAPMIGEHSPGQPFDELFAKLVDYVSFTPLNNVGGGPAIALPHGLMDCGLPGSVQFSAPRGGERTLLELAYELEAISPFPQIAAAQAQDAASSAAI